jgi:lipooligosaccharide transport system permease protein
MLPPVFEPIILLLVFGLGLGAHVTQIPWQGFEVGYLAYIAPGVLAYTAFMTAFFQALFSAFVRMHFQKSWEGQLTTQVRLEHVIWGEALWAASLGTIYSLVVGILLGLFAAFGWVDLHGFGALIALPFLFLAAVAFAAIGLCFTALLPSMDHMTLPFFLAIMPLAFTSSTWFPIESDNPLLLTWLALNPLHHLAEGCRWLLLEGRATMHLLWAAVECLVLILVLIPLDMYLLRRRVLGEG